jgi:hypothetical protein
MDTRGAGIAPVVPGAEAARHNGITQANHAAAKAFFEPLNPSCNSSASALGDPIQLPSVAPLSRNAITQHKTDAAAANDWESCSSSAGMPGDPIQLPSVAPVSLISTTYRHDTCLTGYTSQAAVCETPRSLCLGVSQGLIRHSETMF